MAPYRSARGEAGSLRAPSAAEQITANGAWQTIGNDGTAKLRGYGGITTMLAGLRFRKPQETVGRKVMGAKTMSPLASEGPDPQGFRRESGASKQTGTRRKAGQGSGLRISGAPTKAQRSGFRGEKETQGSETDAHRKVGGVEWTLHFGAHTKAQRSGFRGEKEAQGSEADARRKAGGVERTLRRRGHASPAAGLFASAISKERKKI